MKVRGSVFKFALAMAGSLISVGVSTTTVDAISITKRPTKPSISLISAKVRLGKIDVTVAVNPPSTSRSLPILSTQIKVGTRTCTPSGRSRSCTIKGLASKRYAVSARVKNKNGWGPWSSSVAFLATDGRTWPKGSTAPGGNSTPGGSSTVSLKFSIKNAVGLALKSSVNSASVRKTAGGSNLQAVDSAGNTTDAVATGAASVSRFLIAPNGKVYVIFTEKTMIGSTMCLLAEVSKESGEPICIDSKLDSIQWPGTGYRWPNASAIQFDSSGSIYYVGKTGSTTVLRRYSAGSLTDLITDNIEIENFLTRNDGSVFIGGTTKSSGSNWVRRISTSGSISSISSGARARSLYEMPDGHIWVGLWDGDFGIRRFNLQTQTMIDGYLYSGQRTPSIYTYPLDVCTGTNLSRNYGFCGYDGVVVQNLFRMPDGNVLAVAGSGSDGILMRYYPTISRATTAVQRISVAQQASEKVILTGTNSSGQNVTTIYNSTTDSEQTLIPSYGEIEVYRLNYLSASNKVMFDGLRFSDNKYVIGQIDLATSQVTASLTGSSKLVDFQTFAS